MTWAGTVVRRQAAVVAVELLAGSVRAEAADTHRVQGAADKNGSVTKQHNLEMPQAAELGPLEAEIAWATAAVAVGAVDEQEVVAAVAAVGVAAADGTVEGAVFAAVVVAGTGFVETEDRAGFGSAEVVELVGYTSVSSILQCFAASVESAEKAPLAPVQWTGSLMNSAEAVYWVVEVDTQGAAAPAGRIAV